MQRVAHALAALGDGLVGEADDGEGGIARCNPDLDLDGAGLDADECECGYLTVHGRGYPTQSGPTQSGPTQSRPKQSRPKQSRPKQSRMF